jgi:hypothetical protein
MALRRCVQHGLQKQWDVVFADSGEAVLAGLPVTGFGASAAPLAHCAPPDVVACRRCLTASWVQQQVIADVAREHVHVVVPGVLVAGRLVVLPSRNTITAVGAATITAVGAAHRDRDPADDIVHGVIALVREVPLDR